MKRFLALLIVAIMIPSFSACGNNEETDTITCWSCGETISDTAAYCAYCGSAVADNQNNTDSSTTESTDNNTANGTEDNTQGTTEGPTGGETTETTEPPTTTPPTTTPPTTTPPTTTPPATEAPHTHSYNSKVTTAATCSKTGVKTFTCSCGASYTETINTIPHNYKSTVVPPTCTTDGHTTHICEACGNSYTDNYIDAAHNYINYVCSVCQHSLIPQGYTAIDKKEQLSNITLNGKYILMCDIDMGYAEWEPIGTESTPFTGTFNGNGYSIKNIRIAKSYTTTGFFAYSNGVIENLGIENITMKNGASEMGGLVAINDGTISNCFVTGDISSTAYLLYVGGLVGVNNGTITNCYALCNVSASAMSNASSFAGGLVGENCGKISNCYASGEVKASSAEYAAYAGGLVGKQDVIFNDATITNCFAMGKVDVNAKKSARAGGIVGWTNGSADNCWHAVNFKVTQDYDTTYEPTNIHGVETTLSILKTTSFQKDTLKWSSSIWSFQEGYLPTLK